MGSSSPGIFLERNPPERPAPSGAYRRLEVLKQARELESRTPALPGGPFQVIVADPPWRYEGGNDLPYPTMAIEDIKAMPVSKIGDENAILWLWTTNAHLRVAFEVADVFRELLATGRFDHSGVLAM